MTELSIQELVRKDLLWYEQNERKLLGTTLHAFEGNEAILDAYESALELVCYLRGIIENMAIGVPR